MSNLPQHLDLGRHIDPRELTDAEIEARFKRVSDEAERADWWGGEQEFFGKEMNTLANEQMRRRRLRPDSEPGEVEENMTEDVQPDETGETVARGHVVTLDLINPELLAEIVCRPELLKSLHWRQFECVLAKILEDCGYEIELQRGTKDGGIDIYALTSDQRFGSHKYLLQAKQWSNAVGVEPVREVMFLHDHHRITKSCLATTSRFTSGAWALANQYRWQLALRDFEKLKEWIVEGYLNARD